MRNKLFGIGVLSLALVFGFMPTIAASMQTGGAVVSVDLHVGDRLSFSCSLPEPTPVFVDGRWNFECIGEVSLPTETDTPTNSPTVLPTSSETHAPTLTPIPWTGTPQITATSLQTLTPPASGHDVTRWHGLMDHEHGDDPNAPDIVAIFGPAGDAWNGNTDMNIGVPFATSAIENREADKHRMAKYYTMTRAQKDAAGYPCGREDFDTNATDNSLKGNNCVAAWRILVHGGGNLMEAMSNNHSAFVELLICSRSSNYEQCGIFKSGGWIFWGKLQAPFYGQSFERTGGTYDIGGMSMTFKSDAADLAAIGSTKTVFDGWGGEPYWFMFPYTPNDLTYYRNNPNSLAGDQFSSNEVSPYNYDCAPFPGGCGNNIFHLAVRVFDGWNLLDRDNLYNPIFICTQINPANCKFDGSYRGMKEVQAYISPAWDGAPFDTDPRAGYVSFERYTDRYQRLRGIGECTAIGLDCVPLILQGVPVNYASVKLRISQLEPGIDREYCLPGCKISFPN